MPRQLIPPLLTISWLLAAAVAAAGTGSGDLYELYRKGEIAECLAQARPRLTDDVTSCDLQQLVGRCLVDLGRHAEAREHLEAALELCRDTDWRRGWSLFYMGIVHWDAGEREPARAAWVECRDSEATRNVARNAKYDLLFTGLDEAYRDWPVRTGTHVRAIFSPQLAERDLDGFVAEHDRAYEEITAFYGGGPDRIVDYVVWHDVDEATAVANIRALGYALPEMTLVHCRWEQTPGHELAHVVGWAACQPVEQTRLINEGAAVLLDLSGRDKLADARRAVAEAGLDRIPLDDWWRDGRRVPESIFYPVAGAWVAFLVEQGGQERFRELMHDQTIEAARDLYGVATLTGWLDAFAASLLE